jgi:uncharacterized SAM-binding protein YcdF (DUF218 family)
MGDQYRGNDGKLYDDEGSKAVADSDYLSKTSGGGAGGGDFMNTAASAGGAAAGAAVVALLFIPSLIVKIFDVIVSVLLGLGTVGRVILSAILGLLFCFLAAVIQNMVWKNLADISAAQTILVVGIPLVAVTFWVYFSHYFTLQAILAKNMVTLGKMSIFIKPFAIGFYGFILVAIIHGIGGIVKFFSNGHSGWGMPGIVYWIPIIAGFVYYIVQGISVWKEAKEARKEEGAKPIGALIAVILAGILPGILFVSGMEREGEKTRASKDSLIGQKLTVTTHGEGTINLRAEASGTGRVIKTLNSKDEVIGTGEMSDLWVPVKSGDDEGFVLSFFLEAGRYEISRRFPHPFEAITSAPIQLLDADSIKDQVSHTIPRGTVVTVLRSDIRIEIEIKNRIYKLSNEAAENIVPRYNEDGSFVSFSKKKPAEFPKNAPFEAVVTEAIGYKNSPRLPSDPQIDISIPAGAKVTVTGEGISAGIDQAIVTYNNVKDVFVYWRYLKQAN